MVWLLVTAHVLGFVSSIHAVMSVRTAEGTIAWVATLNTAPYVAVPAYLLFGRNKFEGYVTARRTGNLRIADLENLADSGLSQYLTDEFRKPAAVRTAELLAALPFTVGNHVELLIDGDETFPSILAGIDRAENYILFQFYAVKDDSIGGEVKNRLIKRSRDGVRVYFLYDEVGSYTLTEEYKDDLRQAGIEVYNFHTRQGPRNRFQVNFRNHRKIVVIDGKEGWTGGLNIGDEYLGKDPGIGRWRDTHIHLTGPVVLGMQLSFIEDWHWATGDVPEVSWTPQAASDSDMSVLVVPTGPADEVETATLMFLHAINTAEERIWIASPYFVPDETITSALQLAALRGLDVRVQIPDKQDNLLVWLAGYSYFGEAAKTGVSFYRWKDGFLHHKVMLIDDVAATVGTANFDNRSFRLNFEITAIVTDSTFISEVEHMLEADFAQSRRMLPGELEERSFWFRLAVRLARLTSPLL